MRTRSGAPERRGTTLAELAVVVTLIGLTAAWVVPRLDRPALDADAAARQLRATLQTAQRLAITQQSVVVVGIDSARGALRLLEDRDADLATDAGERVRVVALDPPAVRLAAPPARVDGSAAAGAVVALTRHTIDGLPSVVFRRDGSASESPELYLRLDRRGGTEWRAVVVRGATGRVEGWTRAPAGGPWRRQEP